MARKKKSVGGVQVIDIADKGKCVGRTPEGEIVLLDGALPGQTVNALLLRKKKSLWNGIVQEIIEESPYRVEPKCGHFGVCGGCKWQHLDYGQQLAFKQKQVQDALSRIAKISIDGRLAHIKGCEEIYNYRNKLEFTFSSQRWLTREEIDNGEERIERRGLGFHRPRAFDKVVDIFECHLQGGLSNEIRNSARKIALEMNLPFFDIRQKQGLLRTLMIRTTEYGQTMALFSFFRQDKQIEAFLNRISLAHPDIDALLYCINPKGNDTVYDLEILTFLGRPYIIEELRGVKYKIGPKSFFQTNSKQAECLFSYTIELANIQKSDIVYDLYSGIGSIGLSLAHICKKVVGIETIPEAVEDAMENVRYNDIKNAEFVAGDVKDILNPSFVSKHGAPDIIITDPPRAGMSESVAKYLLEIACPKIVYISCNPSTQARDIHWLSEKYEFIQAQPVDMFPHTSHIENIVLLTLRL